MIAGYRRLPVWAMLLALLLSGSVWAAENLQFPEADGNLTWLTNNWPPYMITSGENKETGMIDLLVKMYIQSLPQYQHIKKEMNWTRFWTDIRGGSHTCNPAAYKNPEREQFALFTSPTTIVIPNSVIIKRENLDKFKNRGSVSFADLIMDKHLKGGLESGRSYSVTIDQILKQHEPDSNITRRVIDIQRHLRLLKYNRIDYILEYPIVVNYAAQNMAIDPAVFASLSIQELPSYAFGYVACPKNGWGEKVVRDLNNVLKKLIRTPGYQNAIEKWYNSERERQIIKKAFSDLTAGHAQ